MTSHADEGTGKEWIKSFSKKYQKDYWYNSITKETSWIYPTSISHEKSIESNDIKTPSSSSSSVASKKRSSEYISENESNKVVKSLCSSSGSEKNNQGSKVAIIVPFRDLHKEQKRKEQLLQFLPKMVAYSQKSAEIVSFRIFIIEQSDDGRKFNRGKLLNIGYELAKRAGFEVFIFHDVDLIPSSDDLLPYYSRIPEGKHPCHIARVWNRYSVNQSYFGGIVSFSSSQFEAVNG